MKNGNKVGYYYLREKCQRIPKKNEPEIEVHIPRVTICLGKDPDGVLCRGIAVCVPEDNFEYKKGRSHALAKLQKAMGRKVSSSMIHYLPDRAWLVLDEAGAFDAGLDQYMFLAHYNVRPINEFEKKIVANL